MNAVKKFFDFTALAQNDLSIVENCAAFANLWIEGLAAQVSEYAYLKSQYDYYLRVNGFSPKFYPIYPNLKFRALWFLNGLAYSKYNTVSKLP